MATHGARGGSMIVKIGSIIKIVYRGGNWQTGVVTTDSGGAWACVTYLTPVMGDNRPVRDYSVGHVGVWYARHALDFFDLEVLEEGDGAPMDFGGSHRG